jgi:hypothetical protein
VVIRDFNIGGVAIVPHKAQAVLIVDTDAELAFAVPSERLKMVSARNRQVGKASGPV